MVFSVNAIATGPNNFAAFQALAMQQNGTSATPSSGAASTPTPTNGASVRSVSHGAGIVVAFVAAIFGALL
jgi:hypothetical protein